MDLLEAHKLLRAKIDSSIGTLGHLRFQGDQKIYPGYSDEQLYSHNTQADLYTNSNAQVFSGLTMREIFSLLLDRQSFFQPETSIGTTEIMGQNYFLTKEQRLRAGFTNQTLVGYDYRFKSAGAPGLSQQAAWGVTPRTRICFAGGSPVSIKSPFWQSMTRLAVERKEYLFASDLFEAANDVKNAQLPTSSKRVGLLYLP